MNEEYVKTLENVIKQMVKPLKNIPFSLVLESLSDYKIIPFNENDKNDVEILKTLKKVAVEAGNEINKSGIISKRPNEVGNKIEEFVKNALNKFDFNAEIPANKNGQKQSVGYPDILFYDSQGKVNYLECKTYNEETENSTMRSFYVSPSENPKITCDAHHFLISFEMYKEKESIFKVKNYKIISLENLLVNVKYEFNANNVELYKNVLASGEIFITKTKRSENV